jgi:hypothetical protein
MAKRTDYDRYNAETAAIILSAPEKYDGLPLEWARMWMERHKALKKEPGSAMKSPAAAGQGG